MADLKSFSIIGTGAVGGFYGALLQRAGCEVHFLLHSDYHHVKKQGLAIDSPDGNFRLPHVNAYNNPKIMPQTDVVILALKTTANDVLKDILPHLVQDNTLVLTLQNGLGSEDEIAEMVGPANVLGGLCFLCANKIGPGHIQHIDYGLISLGEYRKDGQPSGTTPRLQELGDVLQSAGIPIRLEEDLLLARWKKLVWNIPFNGLSVIKDQLTNQLVRDPETRSLCEILMKEVAAASTACARPIEPSFIEKMLRDTEKMEPYAPSMKLDFDRGNVMEVESIYGNPIRAAQSAGVAMPETETLYRKLLALNPAV